MEGRGDFIFVFSSLFAVRMGFMARWSGSAGRGSRLRRAGRSAVAKTRKMFGVTRNDLSEKKIIKKLKSTSAKNKIPISRSPASSNACAVFTVPLRSSVARYGDGGGGAVMFGICELI